MPHLSEFPPAVYVPCAEAVADGAEARLEYRQTKDGRTALLVYSALDRLRRGMGDVQPWILLPAPSLEKVWERDKFDLVLMDIEVPDEHRRRGGLTA